MMLLSLLMWRQKLGPSCQPAAHSRHGRERRHQRDQQQDTLAGWPALGAAASQPTG